MNMVQGGMLVALAIAVAICLALRRSPRWERDVHKMFRDEHGAVRISVPPRLKEVPKAIKT